MLQPGDPVRISHNDAKVRAGSTGRYLGIVPETGNLLVDVDGRGHVAFTKDSVMSMNGAAVTVAQRAATKPEPRRVTLSRELYLDARDTAAELGCTVPQLKVLADLADVGECRGTGHRCHYTYRDIVRMLRFREFMQTAKITSPTIAYSVLSTVREMTGRDPLAPE